MNFARRIARQLFRRQFDAVGSSPRWPRAADADLAAANAAIEEEINAPRAQHGCLGAERMAASHEEFRSTPATWW
jgi:hypothetical protein